MEYLDIEELLAKYFTGNTSDEQNKLIEQWQKQSETNQKIFNQYRIIFKKSLKIPFDFSPDAENALKILHSKVKFNNSKTIALKILKKSWKIAACILILAGIYFLFLTTETKNWKTATTHKTEKKEFILSDGTKVWLNSNSTMKYTETFEAENREVYLTGEAYFKVAKNPDKPFIVYTQNSLIRVLGTAFNVFSKNNSIIVTVSEGKVMLAKKENSKNENIELQAGDKGILSQNAKIEKIENDDPNFLSWKTGKVVFQNTKIEQVIQKLEIVYRKKIIIQNTEIENCKLTAVFENQSIEKIIEIISKSLLIKYEIKDSIIYLK